MEFNEYQTQSRKTAIYVQAGDNLMYPALGLVGESGEVIERLKRIARHKALPSLEDINPNIKEDFVYELGDVLWYLTQFATELGVSLNEVAEKNLDKLEKRKREGTLDSQGKIES